MFSLFIYRFYLFSKAGFNWYGISRIPLIGKEYLLFQFHILFFFIFQSFCLFQIYLIKINFISPKLALFTKIKRLLLYSVRKTQLFYISILKKLEHIFTVYNSFLHMLLQCKFYLTLTQLKNNIAHMTILLILTLSYNLQ